MGNSVAILGASGHGRVIADILANYPSNNSLVGFFESNDALIGKIIVGLPVWDLDQYPQIRTKFKNLKLIVAIGENKKRKLCVERLQAANVAFTNAIHPKATLAQSTMIGIGIAVMAGAVVNCQSKLGNHIIVNTGATIDHDCILEDFVHVSPGAHLAGGVTVKAEAHIGIGASIIQGVTIGEKSIIGAGAVVTKDIPPGVTAVGVPAKVIKSLF